MAIEYEAKRQVELIENNKQLIKKQDYMIPKKIQLDP